MYALTRRAHLVVGIFGIVAFLATGQYMDRYHGHLRGYDDGTRMLFRSAHIYLLLAAIINTMTGIYIRQARLSWRRLCQVIGSAALLAGPPLFLIAFCTEPHLDALDRPWSRAAVYLAFAGVLCHTVAANPFSRSTKWE
ncbi:MAG: hypothetical protein U1D30_13355 [Planctomycetota bacterium]